MENYINEIYGDIGYLDKYGGSLVLTFVSFLIVFFIFSYYYIQSHIKPLRANWDKEKCKPYVLPFAGIINKPPGDSISEYALKNFTFCLSNVLKKVVDTSTMPLKYTQNLTVKLFSNLSKIIYELRGMLNYIRNMIMEVIKSVLGRLSGVIIQLRKILINTNVIFSKIKGIFMTSLYTLVASYMTMKSFMGAFLELLIKFLTLLAAIAILLWFFPWTWAAAGSLTALFGIISIPLVIIAISLGEIMNITSPSKMPDKPGKDGCFDEFTKVQLKRGIVNFKDVLPGDIFLDGSFVTSIFKVANTNNTMYKIDDIIVTGEHPIKYKQHGWIKSSEYPNAIEINNYNKDYIYCINTSNKIINLDNKIFMDWDEVDSLDIEKLKSVSKKNIPNEFKLEHIHKYMDGGFIGTTKIELENGRLVDFKDIEVNDQLKFGERVLATVIIDSKNISGVKIYNFGGSKFICGPNIRTCDKLIGELCSLDIYGEDIENVNKLYHIVTDKNFFIMNGIRFYDYNGSLEPIIWNSKNVYHSY